MHAQYAAHAHTIINHAPGAYHFSYAVSSSIVSVSARLTLRGTRACAYRAIFKGNKKALLLLMCIQSFHREVRPLCSVTTPFCAVAVDSSSRRIVALGDLVNPLKKWR